MAPSPQLVLDFRSFPNFRSLTSVLAQRAQVRTFGPVLHWSREAFEFGDASMGALCRSCWGGGALSIVSAYKRIIFFYNWLIPSLISFTMSSKAEDRVDLADDGTFSESCLTSMTGNAMHLPSVGLSMLISKLCVKKNSK